MSITIMKDDYDTKLLFHCKRKKDCVPLTGSSVFFEFISKKTNDRTGGGDCEVVDAVKGLAKYSFQEGELSKIGKYQGKVTIDMSQGTVRDSLAFEFDIVSA